VTHVGEKFGAQPCRLEGGVARLHQLVPQLFVINCVTDRAHEHLTREAALDKIVLGTALDRVQNQLLVIEHTEHDYRHPWRLAVHTGDRIEGGRVRQRQIEKDDVDSALTQTLESGSEPVDVRNREWNAMRGRQQLAN